MEELVKKMLRDVDDFREMFELQQEMYRDLFSLLLSRNIVELDITDDFLIYMRWKSGYIDYDQTYTVVELVDEIVKNIKEKGEGKK